MTCIVGFCDFGKGKKKSRVILGSDRGLYDDASGSAEVSPHPKIFGRRMGGTGDEFIIGACGDCILGDLLEQIDYTKIKVLPEHQKDAGVFLKKVFVPFLKKSTVKKIGKDSEVLIGVFDTLYRIDDGFGVVAVGEYGMAIGSANAPARATLYALHKINQQGGRKKIDAYEMVRLALEAAESCSMWCRGPFDLMELG
jgi:hypothetical protein